jgi:hypothetical protein
MISSGTIGMPLHFGKVPSFLTTRMGQMGDAIRRIHRLQLRQIRGADTDVRPELVSGSRRGNGDALELIGCHRHRARFAQTAREPEGERSRYLHTRWQRQIRLEHAKTD